MKQIETVGIIGLGALGTLYTHLFTESIGKEHVLLLADSQSLNSYWHATEKTCLKFVLKNRYWIKVKETT